MGRKRFTVKKERTGLIELNPDLNVKVGFLEMDYVNSMSFVDDFKLSSIVTRLITAPSLATANDIRFIDRMLDKHFEVFVNEEELEKENERVVDNGGVVTDVTLGIQEKLILLFEYVQKRDSTVVNNKKK